MGCDPREHGGEGRKVRKRDIYEPVTALGNEGSRPLRGLRGAAWKNLTAVLLRGEEGGGFIHQLLALFDQAVPLGVLLGPMAPWPSMLLQPKNIPLAGV